MASTINADNGVSSGTSGLKSTADTSGVLALQTNGTTALTVSTAQVVTLANPLPVASGGTGGSATATAGGVAYGTGTAQAYTSAGTSGQLLTSNGSSAPTWSDAPAPVPTFTASGSISAAGVTVALNSDGTVSQISGTTTSFNAGTAATPGNRATSNMSAVYDPVNQKVLVVLDYSSYLMGYVGTVSGTTITFGSEQQIFTSGGGQGIGLDYDTANSKFMVANAYSGGIRTAALTISGTSISTGAVTILTSSGGWGDVGLTCTYNPSVGKFLVVANNNLDTCRGWVATISGTAITENARKEVIIPSAFTFGATYSPTSGNILVTYQSAVTSLKYLYVVAITMYSAAPFTTTGTPAAIDTYDAALGSLWAAPIFTGSAKSGYALVIAYYTQGGVFAKGGNETAGNITLTSPVFVGDYALSRNFAAVNNVAGANAAFIFVDGNDSYVKIATVFAAPNVIPVVGSVNTVSTTGDAGSQLGFAYDTSQGKSVAAYYSSSSNRGSAAVITNAGYSTTAQSFIGFSTGSASSGASVGVSMFANMNTNQSGLTLGSKYYVTYTGSISTTNSGFPYAGKAYGTTKIFVGV
jgi:hypothetical protein